MKNALMLALVISFLAIPALAVPENITTDLYKVSFDMGLPRGYFEIDIRDPVATESLAGNKSTEYYIIMSNSSAGNLFQEIAIHISLNEENVTTDTEFMRIALKADLQDLTAQNIESTTREIDGVNGAIASGDLPTGLPFGPETVENYHVRYNPLFDPNHIVIDIDILDIPWDEGALQLLKTIHIEKAG